MTSINKKNTTSAHTSVHTSAHASGHASEHATEYTPKLKVGIIGFSKPQAVRYLNELLRHELVEVTGVADGDADEKASRLPKLSEGKFRGMHFDDPLQLLQADIDALVICTETSARAHWVQKAAKAGVHILCEMPVGMSAIEVREALKMCKHNQVIFMPVLPYRLFPVVQEAITAVKSGQIGQLLAIKAIGGGPLPADWQVVRNLSGGGVLMEWATHMLDLCHSFALASEEANGNSSGAESLQDVAIYTEAGKLHPKLQVEDLATVHVHYENGLAAVCSTYWSSHQVAAKPGELRLELVGTGGVITFDVFAEVTTWHTHDPSAEVSWSYWGENPHKFVIDAFVEAILSGKSSEITGNDALRLSLQMDAVYESLRQRTVVSKEKLNS